MNATKNRDYRDKNPSSCLLFDKKRYNINRREDAAMFGKNLKYYRLKNRMTKKGLAAAVGITPMCITHYENGTRKPEFTTIKKLAEVLNVSILDFMAIRNGSHRYAHCEFRKNSKLNVADQEYICESVEEYFDRFFTVTEILGGEVLPSYPPYHSLEMTDDIEADAQALRKHLGFAPSGPVKDLIGAMENKGILIYLCEVDNDKFSGMNGTVDDRPYIILNSKMTAERQRSTLVHELVHIFFIANKEDKELETHATAVSGAFLLPKEDAYRELGYRRTSVTPDFTLIAKEYGISMQMVAKRAQLLEIITSSAYKDFYMYIVPAIGGRKNEVSRIPLEETNLFEQLVLRAIGQDEISVQKGSELLKMPFDKVSQLVHFQGEA